MAEIVIMPKLGFDMAEGTLVRWITQEGEEVNKGSVLAEIETDKATVEVESNFSGVMARQLVPEGEVVPVNTPIAVIGEKGEEIDYQALLGLPASVEGVRPIHREVAPIPGAEATAPVAMEEPSSEGRLPEGVRASPLARRLAEEQGIDIRQVKGSGPGGRISKADVEAYLSTSTLAVGIGARVTLEMPLVEGEPRQDRHVPLSRLRTIIGRRMLESTQRVPQFYVTHQYDVAALLELRRRINALLPEEDKTSINDFIVKAVALALREFPNLNARLQEDGKEVVHYGQINIGVAVAVENGLLTVVCHNADRKPVQLISAELRAMVSRARQGKVRPEDIEGSTFSLSNMGMFDVDQFTAIINPPEAAILAVGSVMEVPVVQDGQLIPGVRMKATLTVDHRISDGAEGARFLQALANFLEEPIRMLL